MWTKPAATEMRFGFEVTMYVMNCLPPWPFSLS